MLVLQIPSDTWITEYSETAHLLCFGKSKPASFDRIDYALLAVHDDKPLAYVTVRELDPDTVYWQFGGVFPMMQKTLLVARCYKQFIDFQTTLCHRISTCIENTNLPMLRLAMAHGFKINGIRNYQGILVELLYEQATVK